MKQIYKSVIIIAGFLFSLLSPIIAEAQSTEQEQKDLQRFEELAALYNNDKYDDFREKAQEYMPIFKKNGNTLYYKVYQAVLLSYGTQGKPEETLLGAKRMYEEAKAENSLYGIATSSFIIAKAYNVAHRSKDAEKYMNETQEMIEKLIENEPGNRSNLSFMLSACALKADIIFSLKDYDKISALMLLWDRVLREYMALVEDHRDAIMEYYRVYAHIYANLEEYEKAENYCDSVEMLNPEPVTLCSIWEYRSQICEGRGDYEKALSWMEQAIAYREQSEFSQYINLLRAKARILSEMGRAGELYEVYNRAFKLNDSIRNIDFNANLDDLRTQYEVDKYIAEKERNRNYFLFALAGVALLLILVTVVFINRQIIRRKNKTLVLQIKELQELQQIKENELLQKTTFQTPETDTTGLCPESRRDKLCLKLRDLLLKDKIYRDASLSRDRLTEQLGINRHDLEDAFLFCFGMHYGNYINELRLNEAVFMLENSDLLITEISENVGFGTQHTFRRQFVAKYNMSPKDYQQLTRKNHSQPL